MKLTKKQTSAIILGVITIGCAFAQAFWVTIIGISGTYFLLEAEK